MPQPLRMVALAGLLAGLPWFVAGTRTQTVAPGAAEVHLQLATLLFDEGRFIEAFDAYTQAASTPDTRLRRRALNGKVKSELRMAEFADAWTDAQALVQLSPRDPEVVALYADALYHRSLLSMESPTTAPSTAVRDATEAVNTIDRAEYREQACLAIVRFMNTALVADGKIRCSADLTNDTVTGSKGLLMEGMFFLATTRVPGIDRDKGWEWALDSFEKGGARIGNASLGEGPDLGLLRAKLRVGEAISYSCVGLRERGLATMRDVDVNYQAEAEKYFVRYNVKNCVR